MKKIWNLYGWLGHSSISQNNVETIHIDCLDQSNINQVFGLDLVRYAHTLLLSVSKFLRAVAHEHRIKHALVYLPVGTSEKYLAWDPEMWTNLNCWEELPALYLLRSVQTFDEEFEEYRRPILTPVETQDPIRAVFRSFRNQEAMQNSWEFSSGIYLILSFD